MKTLQNIAIIALLLTTAAYAQDEKIDKAILDESCECIGKIDRRLAKEVKNDSIQSCISGSIIADQIKQLMTQMAGKTDSLLQAKVDTTAPGKTYTIYADKNYSAIQKRLLAECPALKSLMQSNDEQFRNSMSDKKKALGFYNEGDRYYADGKYELAIVEYNKAVKADPKFAFAWDNMGKSYRMLKRYKQAIECYDKSLALDPKGSMPLLNKAFAQTMLEDYEGSVKTFEKMISYYPEDPEGYYGAGRMHFALQHFETALDNIFQAYLLYKQTNSPYIHDAETTINQFYGYMKQNEMLDTFNRVAKKYNIEMK